MIVKAYIEAQRNIGDINVSGIAIIVTVRDAESVFPSTNGGAVVDGEESSRPAFGAACAYGWRLISWIILIPQSLS